MEDTSMRTKDDAASGSLYNRVGKVYCALIVTGSNGCRKWSWFLLARHKRLLYTVRFLNRGRPIAVIDLDAVPVYPTLTPSTRYRKGIREFHNSSNNRVTYQRSWNNALLSCYVKRRSARLCCLTKNRSTKVLKHDDAWRDCEKQRTRIL